MQATTFFPDATVHYDETYYANQLLAQKPQTVLRRTMPVAPFLSDADSVLDFGCSEGSVLSALPGSRKAGIEVNHYSRGIAQQQGLDVRGSIEEFQGESFTRIVSCHCLEHVADPAAVLAKLRGLLTSDGKLVLLLPLNDCRDRRQRSWQPGDINQHLYAWTPLILGNLLAVAGYEPELIRVHKYTYPSRFVNPLHRFSPRLYHAVGRVYAMIRPRHQLLAVARLANQ